MSEPKIIDTFCTTCGAIELGLKSSTKCSCGGDLKEYDSERDTMTKFNKVEMKLLKANFNLDDVDWYKPDSMTDREWKEFLEKLV